MDMDNNLAGVEKVTVKARAVKEEEDVSRRAKLFKYWILKGLVDGTTLSSLLKERYGTSIVGGERFQLAYKGEFTPPRRNMIVVCVPEDSDGKSLQIGEYMFEPTGEEPEEVELKKMLPAVSKMSFGERHG
jgi:hypothetical protein